MTRHVFHLIIILSIVGVAQERKEYRSPEGDHFVFFNANKNGIWFGNNGSIANEPIKRGSGWNWPAGTKGFLCFQAGFLLGGMIDGKIRAFGSMYRNALQGGHILADGRSASRTDSTSRIYWIRRNDSNSRDYREWPAHLGAPANPDGSPQFFGDEQLWFVSNSLDSVRMRQLFGGAPLAVEIQTTAWAFNADTRFEDVTFVRQLLINKSDDTITQTYIGLFFDIDVGFDLDDLVGVDTSLLLSFAYNGKSHDTYYDPPPSAGVQFTQLPIVRSPGDTAFFRGTMRIGYTYIPLSGYAFYYACNYAYAYPSQGLYEGAEMLYNNFRGLLHNGNTIVDHKTGLVTKFPFSGNPLTRKGWIDGDMYGPGGRMSLLSAGPFTFMPGDTQEVAYAMFAAQSSDRLRSLEKLFLLAKNIYAFYPDNYPRGDVIPEKKYDLHLDQNFPNPFNGRTVLRYSIPVPMNVRLTVYDFLGRRVATLVDEREIKPGVYRAEWDAPSVSSGVYFYELEAGGYFLRKKMTLIR